MADDDDKIVRPSFGDPPMVIDHREPICLHKYILVRRRARTVWCRSCRQEIDPFDVVLDMAAEWSTATWREREAQELAQRVEQLKTEEANTKARIRNARKQAEQPVEKVELFFNEWFRRLNAVEERQGLYDVDNWVRCYNWITPEMKRQLDDARFRAVQRIEANERAPRRKRGVRVIKGGAGD